MSPALTPKQWRLLEIIGHWSGHGTIEVEIQWGDYDYGDDDEAARKGERVCRRVVAALFRTLKARGLTTDAGNGYEITDAGRAALASGVKVLKT